MIVPANTQHQVHQIDAAIDAARKLACSDVARDEFFNGLLAIIQETTQAKAIAFWSCDDVLTLDFNQHLDSVFTDSHAIEQERQTLARLSPSRSPVTLRPNVVVARLSRNQKPWALVSCYFEYVIPFQGHEGIQRFLQKLGRIVTDREYRYEIAKLSRKRFTEDSFSQLCLLVHSSRNTKQLGFHTVNEGRHFLDCDRLILLARHRSGFRTIACSGQSRCDRNSELLSRLEYLTAVCSKTGESLVYPESTSELPPQISVPLQQYLDLSPAQHLRILPLADQERTCAAIVVEYFNRSPQPSHIETTKQFARHVEVAIARTQEREGWLERFISIAKVPFRIGVFNRVILTLLAMVAGAGFLVFFEVDFTVLANGKMQPANRQFVFASADGFITHLVAEHGMKVSKAERLAKIESHDLEFQLRSISGETKTVEQQLSTANATSLQFTATDSNSVRDASKLTADQLELKTQLQNLRQQQELVQNEIAKLVVRSPLNGTILNWDLERVLTDRPVRRGQALFEVAQLDGPWVMRLDVFDRRISHVLEAKKSNPDLPLTITLRNQPDVRLSGSVGEIDLTTILNDDGVATVAVNATLDEPTKQLSLRPGASIVGRIHCGKRSIGFVWFHEMIAELRRRLF